jgi:SAM-dependent methyltransferase
MKKWLINPIMRDSDTDDSHALGLRRKVIQSKPFLRRIYQEWYQWVVSSILLSDGRVLELGSGMGFLADYIPGLFTSEVIPSGHVSLITDARDIPIAGSSLHSIVLIDVFHHIPDARRFLVEVVRTLRVGGLLILVEPWMTSWSRFIYTQFHPEPFLPNASNWEFPSKNPLYSANGALSWIVFKRDRAMFEQEFPLLKIVQIQPFMPFRYLLSGGITYRSFQPGWSFPFWKSMENCLSPWFPSLGMFVKIILRRTDDD